MVRLAEQGLARLCDHRGLAGPAIRRRASPDRRTDVVRGRLDAVMIAARVAPLTNRIGLVPSVTVTHTEPFHMSKAIATLDFVSFGAGRSAGADLRST